ncbi:MAG TPA: DNA-protecting protein DprA [candidate division Zixibacteria bacterium]|nr:DNA-protecting protein DprA [candidate division Zixibacteria bacterium]
MEPTEKQRIYWHLALSRVPFVGPVTVKALLDYFGDPKTIFLQDRANLGKFMKSNAIDNMLNYDPEKDSFINEEIDRIEEKDVRVLTPIDKEYPRLLRSILDPPSILYVKGDLTAKDEIAVGIVGTRRATRYGIEQARRFSEYLVKQGLTIVSGMAMGVDGNAQEAAMQAGGRTVAALGCGVDVIYPSINRSIYEKITQNGAIVSEYPMGTQPAPENFPKRNRIISGMSLGVLVVEGGLKSGALITYKYALDQGREVFALPGPIDRQTSEGPNMLIQKGATVITDPRQIIDYLNIPAKSKEARRKALDIAESLEGIEKIIYETLDYDGKHIDKISRESKMDSQHVLMTLSVLELRDLVKRLPGMNFAKNV